MRAHRRRLLSFQRSGSAHRGIGVNRGLLIRVMSLVSVIVGVDMHSGLQADFGLRRTK